MHDDRRHVADLDDRAAQRVLHVGEARRERAVERPDERRRRLSLGARRRGGLRDGFTSAPLSATRAAAPGRPRGARRSASRSPRPDWVRDRRRRGCGRCRPASCARSARRSPWSSAGRRGSVRYAATYHLYGRSGPHASRSRRGCLAPPAAHSRASSSSERSSLGNVGVPVLPAIQSICAHVRASNTCSHASRAVPARWLYDSPLRITSAASCGIAIRLRVARPSARRRIERRRSVGADAAQRLHQMRLAHLGLAVGGRRERRHHARDAERARPRVALSPAFGDDVDDDAAAALLPVVLARPLPVGAGGAALHLRRCRARSRAAAGTARRACRRAARRAVGRRERASRAARPTPLSARASTLRAEQQVALAAIARSASAQPPFQPNASAIAWISHGRAQGAKPWSAQNMRSRKRAEFERISWPRRLSATAAPSASAQLGALGGEPARADLPDRRGTPPP